MDINHIISALKGQSCWHVSAGGSTWPTFLLACGEKIPRERELSNLAQAFEYRQNRGSVELLVWCSWRLELGLLFTASSSTEEDSSRPNLEGLIGRSVVNVTCDCSFGDLKIDFSEGQRLSIFCDILANKDNSLPNWELWEPNNYCRIGPGNELEIENIENR